MATCGGSGSGSGPGFLSAEDAKMMAKNSPVVWAEIAAIQQAILTSLCNCNNGEGGSGPGSCVTVKGNTPMTFIDGLKSIRVVTPGRCYCPVKATVKFQHLTGMGASANAIVANGVVTDIVMVSGGGGYINADPTVYLEHPIGVGFRGVVMVNHAGVILGVSIQEGGILYADVYPTANIIDPTEKGSGAVTKVNVNEETCGIESVDIVKTGIGYSAETYGEIIPAPNSKGIGASIDVTVNDNPYGTDPYQYYLAHMGEQTDCNLVSQIDQVKSYFMGLGYQVRVDVNPDTGATIQWTICWC